PIIPEAAAVLLRRSEKGLNYVKDEDEWFGRLKFISQIFAMVDARKNDFAAAAGRMRHTLDQIRQRKWHETSPEVREQWEKNRRDQIAAVEAEFAEYIRDAERGKRGK